MARSKKAKKGGKELVLGWRVDERWIPLYWKATKAKSGLQPDEDLIASDAKTISHHTIIVAQSGAGKSFFLGRLLEEILLRTKCRVVLFDPNSDFRKFSESVASKLWREAKWDPDDDGHLPHERTRGPFTRRWTDLDLLFFTVTEAPEKKVAPIQLNWLDLSVDWFTDNASPGFQSEMRHCHAFVNDYFQLTVRSKTPAWLRAVERSTLEDAHSFLGQSKGLDRAAVYEKLKAKFKAGSEGTRFDPGAMPAAEFDKSLERFWDSASRRRVHVTEEAFSTYFSIADETRFSPVFAKVLPPDPYKPARVHVIDLLSVEDRGYRLMAISKFLSDEWRQAKENWQNAINLPEGERDQRVPTFIVVDEAHNLISDKPDDAAARRLRDQFRTIAAEGRKFGLYLILVSQRPDKLDANIVSECENHAIMKMSSEMVLDETARLLGLSNAVRKELDACLTLKPGRAILCGPWAKDGDRQAIRLYGAMRRTKEGGKNLSPAHWAKPFPLQRKRAP